MSPVGPPPPLGSEVDALVAGFDLYLLAKAFPALVTAKGAG
jgi:hypothetical protein